MHFSDRWLPGQSNHNHNRLVNFKQIPSARGASLPKLPPNHPLFPAYSIFASAIVAATAAARDEHTTHMHATVVNLPRAYKRTYKDR